MRLMARNIYNKSLVIYYNRLKIRKILRINKIVKVEYKIN